MQNPFETGHIKNYLLLYVSIVVIMVLFFIASTLFHDVRDVETKVFSKATTENLHVESKEKIVEEEAQPNRFKLLERAY